MSFELDRVIPWGRSFEEYRKMFALSDSDLKVRILGVADGPASFNTTATERKLRVVSCDPLYQFTPREIKQRIDETFEEVLSQAETNHNQFVWEDIPDPMALGQIRGRSMEEFLSDFERNDPSSRYVSGVLPHLPFADGAFDLALCSHFLFLYSDRFDLEFHRKSIQEMLRVAREIRIFPLLTLEGRPSPHLSDMSGNIEALAGYRCTIEKVLYEFQKGGNEMLRVERSGYAGMATYYSDLFPVSEPVAKALNPLVESCLPNDRAWLDVGCGTGALVEWLRERGVAAYGIDPDPEFIAEAQRRTNGLSDSFAIGGMVSWGPFADRTFGVITCLGNVLAHAATLGEVSDFLEMAAEHLSPDGVLLLQTVNFDRVIENQAWSFPVLERKNLNAKSLLFHREYFPQGDRLLFRTKLEVDQESFKNQTLLSPFLANALENVVRDHFSEVERWGNFEKATWHLNSPATILCAKK